MHHSMFYVDITLLGRNCYWETESGWERGRDKHKKGYQWSWEECEREQNTYEAARNWEPDVHGSGKKFSWYRFLPVNVPSTFQFKRHEYGTLEMTNVVAFSTFLVYRRKLKQTSWSLHRNFLSLNSSSP